MNAIDHALDEYLRNPVPGEVEVARERSALPLYRGWNGTVFLTTAGEFLFFDEEENPAELRPEHDLRSQLMSLVVGAERYPLLSNLLPPRSTENENCKACGGTGNAPFGKGRVLCGECTGVGWPGEFDRKAWLAETSALPYPPFDEAVRRLQALAATEGLHGRLVFISSSDVAFLRSILYVVVPDLQLAFERARREYNSAARHRLGVLLATAGSLEDGRVVAHVSRPSTASEAVNRMYPDGLKLSVLTSSRVVRVVGRIRLAMLRAIAALQPNNPTVSERLR